MTYLLGDTVTLTYTQLASATVAVFVTAPDGTESTPTPSNVLTAWSATVTGNQLGLWLVTWQATGTATDTAQSSFTVAPPTYATLAELKAYLRITDTADDTQLLDSLLTASRGIDHYCSRRFYPDSAASARTYHPRDWTTTVADDFWTTTSLAIALDDGDTGTFSTVLTTADYSLEPSNGVVDGEPGWPFYRIVAVNRDFVCGRRPSVQVTAKWGWAAVPSPIKQACVYLAEEAYKLKGSPFGVASFDQFGPIRMRENPRVMSMLNPYRLYPVLVA